MRRNQHNRNKKSDNGGSIINRNDRNVPSPSIPNSRSLQIMNDVEPDNRSSGRVSRGRSNSNLPVPKSDKKVSQIPTEEQVKFIQKTTNMISLPYVPYDTIEQMYQYTNPKDSTYIRYLSILKMILGNSNRIPRPINVGNILDKPIHKIKEDDLIKTYIILDRSFVASESNDRTEFSWNITPIAISGYSTEGTVSYKAPLKNIRKIKINSLHMQTATLLNDYDKHVEVPFNILVHQFENQSFKHDDSRNYHFSTKPHRVYFNGFNFVYYAIQHWTSISRAESRTHSLPFDDDLKESSGERPNTFPLSNNGEYTFDRPIDIPESLTVSFGGPHKIALHHNTWTINTVTVGAGTLEIDCDLVEVRPGVFVAPDRNLTHDIVYIRNLTTDNAADDETLAYINQEEGFGYSYPYCHRLFLISGKTYHPNYIQPLVGNITGGTLTTNGFGFQLELEITGDRVTEEPDDELEL